ncbi:MAG: hypothetical protein EOM26_07165 [Alphaproteobacteria bacterium]|nr:hypothetical protein [Alphaproteobacteria bacterium]
MPLRETMQSLKSRLDALLDDIPAGARIVHLDVPMYLNIGDQLIDWGTETFLASHGLKTSLRLSVRDYRRDMHLIRPEDVILFQGGGNMNELWPVHEALRQDILKAFPKNKIVLFPQTIFFRDEEKGKTILRAYEEHGNCVLYARDRASLDFVTRTVSVPCKLSPDMAHALWQAEGGLKPAQGGSGTLHFMRRDAEAPDGQQAPDGSVDWDDLIPPADKLAAKYIFAAIKRCPPRAARLPLVHLWEARKRAVIRRCVRTFSGYGEIHTNRLHAVILGCLLGKKVSYHDNSYGKLSGYADCWLRGAVEKLNEQ